MQLFHSHRHAVVRIEPLESRIAPATFLVTNTNDGGAGSLRQAILDANLTANSGVPDVISFASIPMTGAFVIQPLTPLPVIGEAVIIDGYTAPNTFGNTLVIGTNAVLRVEIDASLQGFGHGLVLGGTGGSTVKGLVIRGTTSAINDNGHGVSVRSDNNLVAGNFIGTDVTGTLDFGNASAQVSVGLFLGTDTFVGNVIGGTMLAARNILSGGANGISLTDDSFGTVVQGNLIGTDRTGNVAIPSSNAGISGLGLDTLIGGGAAGAGNVISGSDGWGINFAGTNTTIQGNIIGLNAAGNTPLPNTRSGINFSNGAQGAMVGGSVLGQGNVIAGNNGEGIEIGSNFGDGPGNAITVMGNFIGTDASGAMPLGNNGAGIGVYGTNGAIIGGVNPGQRNVIAFNGGDGVFMQQFASDIHGVTVSGNSIHSNSRLGISIADFGDNFFGVTANDSIDDKDGDSGANGLQNFPIGTGFTNNGSNITLDGFIASKANASYRLEFFAMAPGQVDLSGHGEGFVFLGSVNVTTTIDGDASFTFGGAFSLPSDTKFAATATDLTTGETSEFGPAFGPSATYTWTGAAGADWFNPSNWSPGGVPGPLDTAVLGSGTITLTAPVSVRTFEQSGGTLGGFGELNVLNTWTWTGGTHVGGTLRTIDGALATLNGATALQWMDGDLENFGTLTVQGLGVQFERGTFSNEGDVTLLAGFIDSNPAQFPVTVFNYGTIIKTGATDFGFEGITVENQGGLLRSESTSFFPNFLIGTVNQYDGVTAIAGGGYIVPGGIHLFGGFFDGSNTGEFVTATITNSGGVVRPGGPDAVGFIFLTGDYIQTSGGTLEIEIGTGLGFPSDEFYVSGGSIDGALLHKTIDGRIIRAGDAFSVVQGSLSGSFSTVNGATPLNVGYNASEITLFATGFTVTNVNDSGTGSLRQAILSANAQPGVDYISFNIPGGGVQTIAPITALPDLDDDTVIDAYSQPGASRNTLGVGTDAVLLIELTGQNVPNGPGGENGLTVSSGNVFISGLIINRWNGYGIVLNADSIGSTIVGNWIGPDASGVAGIANNQFGILLDGADAVRIGSADPRDRNVISGNAGNGIEILSGSTGTTIRGNYIGTMAGGLGLIPNGFDGINTQGGNTIIGGGNPGEGNVISGSLSGSGVVISTASAAGSLVQGNFIGTSAVGTADLGNFDTGITIFGTPNLIVGGSSPGAGNVISGNGFAGLAIEGAGAGGVQVFGNFIGMDITGAMGIPNGYGIYIGGASNATIGGFFSGEGNGIAFNTDHGIQVEDAGGTAQGNTIEGNAIFSNGGLGINLLGAGDPLSGVTPNDTNDADTGPNGLLNFPTLDMLSAGILSGTYHGLAGATFGIAFYVSSAADPSGNGEGVAFIGGILVTTDGAGNATFDAPISAFIAPGSFLTATARHVATGSTSEFSPVLAMGGGAQTFVWDNGAGDSDWFNPINWDLDSGVPGINDTAILNIASTINLPSSVSISALEQSSGVLGGAGLLTVTGALTWSGGNIELPITTSASSNNILGGAVPMTLDGALLNLGGTTTFGGALSIGLTGTNAELRNSGAFTFTSAAGISGTGAFHNFAGSAGVVKSGSDQVILDVAFLNGAELDILDGVFALTGGGSWLSNLTVTVGAGAFLDIVAGAYTFQDGDAFVGPGTTHLHVGTFIFGGDTAAIGLGHTLEQFGGTLSGTADLVVAGTLIWSGGEQEGPGETVVTASGLAFISGSDAKSLDSRVIRVAQSGSLNVIGDGTITLADGSHIVVGGSMDIGAGAAFNDAGGAPSGIDIVAGGAFTKSDTSVTMISIPVTNEGVVQLNNGAVNFLATFTQPSGATVLDGGGLGFANPAEFQGGVLSGNGGLLGSINNTGATIRPGGSPGVLIIDGDYTQGPGGTLEIELTGVGVGQFDALNVSGTATLDGTLSVMNVGGFIPTGGDTYEVLVAGSRSNTFTTISSPGFIPQYIGESVFLLAGSLEVFNANDSGPGTLRDAILTANALGGTDTITFNIGGTAPFNIGLLTPLPTITEPIVIDGYTQPGATVNGSTFGTNANILIRLDGTAAGAGADGLNIIAGNSTVRGLIIGGFNGAGIRISGAGGSFVVGNFIGTDGTSAFGNSTGIFVDGSSGNFIGNVVPGSRNLISGNSSASGVLTEGAGIVFSGFGATGNRVDNTYIGTDASGLLDLGNSKSGIGIYDGANDNIIGGNSANVISGNDGHGVDIAFGSNDNSVLGNLIGLSADGANALGNIGVGVLINFNSDGNVIASSVNGAPNVISGNFSGGIAIGGGSAGNTIVANRIGTTKDGTSSLANSSYGIALDGAGDANLIGSGDPTAGNLISGGTDVGIRIENGTTLTNVQGNTIGLRADGTPIGDSSIGIRISSSSGNSIGGLGAFDGNIIHNDRLGIVVNSGTGNRIAGNTFLSGVDTPIDLGDDEADDNDPGDIDTGPNNRQNYPVITDATATGNSLGVAGTLDTLPGTYTIQFYRSFTTSDFDHGDGTPFATFQITVSSGTTPFSLTIPGVGIAVGENISAIAILDANGDTSEFSLAFAAAGGNPGVVVPKDPFTFTDENGDTVKVSLTGRGTLNVVLQGGATDSADIASIEIIGSDLSTKLTVAIANPPGAIDVSSTTTIGSIFTTGALQHVGAIALGSGITLGDGVADANPELRVTGKMNSIVLDDLAANAFLKFGEDLPYELPGKDPDTKNNNPSLVVGDVLGAGVNIEMIGDGTAAGVGGGGFSKVTFHSWAFEGLLSTSQSIGKFLVETGDFFGVLKVDPGHLGEQTTANVGSMQIADGSWGSSGTEIEGNIGSFDVDGFLAGATITAGSMGSVKSSGPLAGTFILTDPDAGGVPTFTVNSDFSASIVSAVSIKKLKIKGDFTGSLTAPSIGSISAFSFLGSAGVTKIVTNAGKLGFLTSSTGVIRDYEIITDQAFSGIKVKARNLSADTVGIDNVSITAPSIGAISVDLGVAKGSLGIDLIGIRNSSFFTTGTGTTNDTLGNLGNVTVTLKGGVGGNGSGIVNATFDARVLAAEFTPGSGPSAANKLGNITVSVKGFGGASVGIANGRFEGDSIGKTKVSVALGAGGTAQGVDMLAYVATGGIQAMTFDGDVTLPMVSGLTALAGGKIDGVTVRAKSPALGSMVDGSILAGQSLILTGDDKALKTALKNASLGNVTVGGSLMNSTLGAGGNLGKVSIGADATDSLILAGASLGSDAALGGGNDTYRSATAIAGIVVNGPLSRTSIAAGVDPVNGIFGDADDVAGVAVGALGGSAIGVITLGATAPTGASTIAHAFAIQAAAIKSLNVSGLAAVKDFTNAIYLDGGAAGEDVDDILVRLRA